MTKPNTSLIGILVDRSGSMLSCRAEMESGIATFLSKQVEEPVATLATLAQFDTAYDVVYGPTPVADVPHYTLSPRYGTALLDAMGRFITDIGSDLHDKKESKRPTTVIIVIVTDGEENSSHEYSRDQIKKMVEHQKAKYNWEFVFLGANMDAVAQASSFGIARGSALTFDTRNAPGVFTSSVSDYVSAYNSVGAAAFTAEDREDAMQDSTT